MMTISGNSKISPQSSRRRDAQDARCVLRAFYPDLPFRRRRARTRRRPSPAALHCFPSPQRGRYGSRHRARPARLRRLREGAHRHGNRGRGRRPACKRVGPVADDPTPPPLAECRDPDAGVGRRRRHGKDPRADGVDRRVACRAGG